MFSISSVVLFYLAGLLVLLMDNAETRKAADGSRT